MTTYAVTADVYVMPPHLAGHPEVTAMIGAYFSRSWRPMRQRVQELGLDMDEVRAKLRHYVVGYGHDSILDMANVTVAVEGIPILAAVALEDHALFSGQESSTRFIDWSEGEFVNPVSADQAPELHEAIERHYAFMREQYVIVQRRVYERIVRASGVDEPNHLDRAAHLAAIKARSFDVARGWLPAGAITRVCWTGRLSSMKAHLRDLAVHPDANVVALAARIWRALEQRYPDAMGKREVDEPTDVGYAQEMWEPLLHHVPAGTRLHGPQEVSTPHAHAARDALQRRKWCEPISPKLFLGQRSMLLTGHLDYGSMRDLHRHRRGVHRFEMPLPASTLDFVEWYWEMAGTDGNEYARQFTTSANSVLAALPAHWSESVLAHVMPLMTRVPFEYEMDVPQLVYLMERRTTTDVHPTLRAMLHEVAPTARTLPLTLHVTDAPDPGPDGYVLRRGKQTITVNGRDISEEK